LRIEGFIIFWREEIGSMRGSVDAYSLEPLLEKGEMTGLNFVASTKIEAGFDAFRTQ